MIADLEKTLSRDPRWRWMHGMLGLLWAPPYGDHLTPMRALRHRIKVGWISTQWFETQLGVEVGGHVPDLADPATQGCLWAMLCEDLASDGCTWEATMWSDGSIEVGPGDDTNQIFDFGIEGRGIAIAHAILALWGALT